MSVTIWIDTAAERTIELGGFLSTYEAMSEMAHIAGGDDVFSENWPALASMLDVAEEQEDCSPSWLASLKDEAARFLAMHGPESRDVLSLDATDVLERIVHQP